MAKSKKLFKEEEIKILSEELNISNKKILEIKEKNKYIMIKIENELSKFIDEINLIENKFIIFNDKLILILEFKKNLDILVNLNHKIKLLEIIETKYKLIFDIIILLKIILSHMKCLIENYENFKIDNNEFEVQYENLLKKIKKENEFIGIKHSNNEINEYEIIRKIKQYIEEYKNFSKKDYEFIIKYNKLMVTERLYNWKKGDCWNKAKLLEEKVNNLDKELILKDND